MLDPIFIRDHTDEVRTGLKNRGLDVDKALTDIATFEILRRRLIGEYEGLKRQQNTAGDEIAKAKRQGKDAGPAMEASRTRAAQIKQLGVQLDSIEHQRDVAMEQLPNVPHASVPVGKSSADNQEIHRHGEPTVFDFEPKPHWELGTALGIIDFERATKMSGARFSVLAGAGARLARALIGFMLDLHTREHGYTEILPPFLANSESLFGTGQLPKFEEDLFQTRAGYYLFGGPVHTYSMPRKILDGGIANHFTAYAVLPQRKWIMRTGCAGPDSSAPVTQSGAGDSTHKHS
jgi:seryl-tRNA synthetase